MNSVKKDIEITKQVLIGDWDSNCGRIYFETNEYVSDILRNFDIRNKTVLTVLGSGDQAFHLYNRGASKVDVFDVNSLSIHYYYLRRWTIMFFKMSYPPYNFNNNFLLKLLSYVEPKDRNEKKSLNYWFQFSKLLDDLKTESKELFCDSILQRNETVFDNGSLGRTLSGDTFSFYNINLARRVVIPHKYDIVYLSNIANYVNQHGDFNSFRLNLKRLVKNGGLVISSRVNNLPDPKGLDEIKKSFIYCDLDEIEYPEIGKKSPGYYYTKR